MTAPEVHYHLPEPAGLTAEQTARAQAALAIGWQHPSDTDLPDYHAWWWAELDRLADWIRHGTPPATTRERTDR